MSCHVTHIYLQVGKLPSGLTPGASARPLASGTTVMRPAGVAGGVARPTTFARPALPTRPVQISSSSSLMPPPKVGPTWFEPFNIIRPVINKIFFQAPGLVIKKSGSSLSTDDDINDVTAMGGVNLSDEARKLGSEHVGSILRSTKDTAFLQNGLLHQKVARICKEKGLEAPPQDVLNLISAATQERLKTCVSKLSVIAEHRMDLIKSEGENG